MNYAKFALQSTPQEVKDLSSQVTHPIADYDEARIAKLLAACEENRRHTWPDDMELN